MPRAQKGEVRNPKGRTPGIKNKSTLERERLAMEAMRSAATRKAMGATLSRLRSCADKSLLRLNGVLAQLAVATTILAALWKLLTTTTTTAMA